LPRKDKRMKKIAVVTSGGDAPGINAAVRAIVRTAIDQGGQTFGVRHGYCGLTNDDLLPLSLRDVGGIMQHGGTILASKRYPEFKVAETQEKAIHVLQQRGIDVLVVIGGDGSQAGAFALSKKGFSVVGIASTIDNDLFGSEISIGVDTALNVALEAIDRIKVTASSHERAFLVEVMGRNCGYLALMAGIAGGAECIILPEASTDPERVASDLRSAYERGKPHAIVVVAEGADYNADRLTRYFREHHERLGFELRDVKLGHVQRGGTPGFFDRLLATRFGAAATDCVARNEYGVLVGLAKSDIKTIPLDEIIGKRKPLDAQLLKLANILAQ
jgi:6-phosphofructokinase 1